MFGNTDFTNMSNVDFNSTVTGDNNTTFNEVVSLGYCEDDVFSKLMSLFLRLMRKAEQYGGLYSDNIVSN